ncbi:MAG: hypothetical protein QM758_30180 [Armatimonas sp.]
MEIHDLHRERQDRRSEGIYREAPKDDIKRIGLECSGFERSYCAIVTPDGSVTYKGHGRGLEGIARGKVDLGYLFDILQFLEAANIDALADEYHYGYEGTTVTYYPGTLDRTFLLVESKTFLKTIQFHDGIALPQMRLVVGMFDLLLDSATWNKHGFFIQRNLSAKPPVKRKWG